MVGHPAGVAQGQPGQAAPLTPEQARRLLSPAGREAVAFAATLDLAPATRLAAAEAVRAAAGPELGPLALEQAVLRARARSKHPAGDRLWWTAEALEQASSYDVAVHRAQRYAGSDRVLDLCCSVGGDLLPLAAEAPAVGVDLDEARLLLARENARELDLPVGLVRADVTRLVPRGAVFADPARRSGGRRVFDGRAYTPSLDVVLGWLPHVTALGVKVAPGIDYATLPPEVEVEVVSLRGEVKEAVLWGGSARRGVRRTATLLPGGDVLTDTPAPVPQVLPPGAYLLEPDGAVIRAGLVAQVADLVGGWLLDPTIAYVSAAAATPTPYGRWYAVRETLPFGLKPLRERLRALDAGPLVVKKRGTAVEPEELRRRLKLTGSREVTVVLTRVAGRQVAMVVEPVPTISCLGRRTLTREEMCMAIDVGDEAPDFELQDQDRNPVRLSSYRGEKNVVLVFYPLSFTGVCQGELCAIRDSIADFSGDDVVTLAVSVDSTAVHKKWADEQGYTFPLLSDFWPHGEVARAYGVFEEAIGLATRGTFIIDKKGRVAYRVRNAIPDARDPDEYRRVLASL